MLGVIVVGAFVVLDRLTKVLAVQNSTLKASIIPHVLSVTSAVNTAGPLGLPISGGVFFVLSFVVASLLFVFVFFEERRSNQALFLAIIVGILSNTIDRMQYGYAIDVLRLEPGLVFNIADLLIVGGVVLLFSRLVHQLFTERHSLDHSEHHSLD
ncbi:MAG: signal peptidase II [Patescibacteria group bacterium]